MQAEEVAPCFIFFFTEFLFLKAGLAKRGVFLVNLVALFPLIEEDAE
jgi:hypothetical protein